MIDYLKKVENKTLAEFWCYFNNWEYPPELDIFRPSNWGLLPTQIKYKINKPAINYIKSRVSEKELLREWNKNRMKGIDFDVWWENGGNEPISDLGVRLLDEMYKIENSNLN